MPKITAQGKTFECEAGANLRQVLRENGVDLYNGQAKMINCRGISTCAKLIVHFSYSRASHRAWGVWHITE